VDFCNKVGRCEVCGILKLDFGCSAPGGFFRNDKAAAVSVEDPCETLASRGDFDAEAL
jgi:hypothetical protein